MRSPAFIELALWYWARAEDHPKVACGLHAYPFYSETIDAMLAAGMLVRSSGAMSYEPTEAMRVYVEALGSVPLPVQVWAIPKQEAL